LFVDENNPNLVYSKLKRKEQSSSSTLYRPKLVGNNAEFSVVSSVAHHREHDLRLKESMDFEDPWWNKSVKDQVFVHHVHETLLDDGSWDKDNTNGLPALQQLEKDLAAKRDEIKKQRMDQLAIANEWGRRPRNPKSVWAVEVDRTQFTRDGTLALEDYTKEALERNIEIALKEYHETSDEIAADGKPNFTGLSKSAAHFYQTIMEFREELGGEEKVDVLADKFVKYADKTKKESQKSGSIFDGKGMDFVDACVKANAIKVISLLMIGADPNTVIEDEGPLIVLFVKKVFIYLLIRMDIIG
jgi:hypothetical protein